MELRRKMYYADAARYQANAQKAGVWPWEAVKKIKLRFALFNTFDRLYSYHGFLTEC